MIRQGQDLQIFAFPGSLGFLLTAHRWFLVVLTLADFLLNTRLRAASLEPAKSAVQRLAVFYDYICHAFLPTSPLNHKGFFLTLQTL